MTTIKRHYITERGERNSTANKYPPQSPPGKRTKMDNVCGRLISILKFNSGVDENKLYYHLVRSGFGEVTRPKYEKALEKIIKKGYVRVSE